MEDDDVEVFEDIKDVKKKKEEDEEEELGPETSEDLLVPEDEIRSQASLVWDEEPIELEEEDKSEEVSAEVEEKSSEEEKSEISVGESEEISEKSSESMESDSYVSTYQLGPYVPYVPENVQAILDFAVPLYFEDIKYDPDLCVKMCRKLSSYVLKKIYRLNMDRRKIIVIVRCHEKNWQSERAIYRFLWNQQADGHANFTLDLQDMIVSAIVLVLYVD